MAWVVGAPEIEDIVEIATLPGSDGDRRINSMAYDDGTRTLFVQHGQCVSMLQPITRSTLSRLCLLSLSLRCSLLTFPDRRLEDNRFPTYPYRVQILGHGGRHCYFRYPCCEKEE